MTGILSNSDASCLLLAQAFQRSWLLEHVPVMVFIFCFGACVGSFLNVVIYRLPAGMSVTTPPSRCPTCGARLKFFRENLPIIGWFLVKGRCRYCKVGISSQYMLIELMMALLFLGLYIVFYCVPPDTQWWGQIGGTWWFNRYNSGLWRTWPVFIAYAFLLASLVAMTVIDARSFTIPIQIPVFVTITAFIAYPLQAALYPLRHATLAWPIQATCWTGTLMALGGMLGVLIAYILLRAGRLRYSFADYHEYLLPSTGTTGTAGTPGTPGTPGIPGIPGAPGPSPINTEQPTPFELIFALPCLMSIVAIGFLGVWGGLIVALAAVAVTIMIGRARGLTFADTQTPTGEQVLAPEYPHARREMLVELVFLLPCVLGLVAGCVASRWMPDSPPPVILQALGGTFAGYLVGGGLIWGIRILGTLVFGREAMGLGDVHLLGAVGAVVGWFDPILIFFIAPFFGLLWAFVSMGIASIFKGAQRALPYGPHLAVATLMVILLRPGLRQLWGQYMPTVPWPTASLCAPPGLPGAAAGGSAAQVQPKRHPAPARGGP